MFSNTTPSNMNPLGQTTFQFNVIKLPMTSFFVQNVDIPSVSLPSADYPNPLVNIPIPGDHITYDPLNITFLLDEDLKNYIELYSWIRGLGFPETNDEYAALNAMKRGFAQLSDAELVVMDGKHLANLKFTFIDAHPTSLSGITMQYTDQDIEYRTCTATFAYTRFDVESLR